MSGINVLISDARSASPIRRYKAIKSLADCSDVRAEDTLLEALNDDDKFIREYAAQGLVNINPNRPIEPILEALRWDDVDLWLRDARLSLASRSHKERLDPSKLTPAVKIVLSGIGLSTELNSVEHCLDGLSDSSRTVRGISAAGLGEYGDSRVVDPLISLLRNDEAYWVRVPVINALTKLKDPRAVEPLIPLLGKGRRNRKAARIALTELGPLNVDSLEYAAKHAPGWRTRWEVRRILRKLRRKLT